MDNWIIARLRDAFRTHMAHGKDTDPEAKLKRTWQDYRGSGLTELAHSLDRWGDARALFTILSAAVTADNDTDPKESTTLDAIIIRARTFRRMSRDDLKKHIDAAAKDLVANRMKALEKATRSYYDSEARRISAYLHALEILHADQHFYSSEEKFATQLAEMLTLDKHPQLLDQCNKLSKAKNWSASQMSTSQTPDEKHKAFFTILAAAVLIDGEFPEDEKAELIALMSRTKTLSHFEEAARTKLRDEITGSLEKNFKTADTRWDLVDTACQTLVDLEKDSKNAGICYSAFLHAVDLTLADRKVMTSETNYLKRLEENFKFDKTKYDAELGRELLAKKNQY